MQHQQGRGVTAAMMDGLALPQPPRISIREGRFSLVDRAGGELNCNLVDPQVGYYLDVVIIAANPVRSKILFEGDWTPGSTDPPLCWSDNGLAPSSQAISPQHTVCGECQWNKIGSGTSKLTGKPIKLCQDRKKLAVFVVGGPPDLYQLVVTPGALKNIAAYGKWIGQYPNPDGTGAADVSDVVTRIYFEQGQVGVLGFQAVGSIDTDMVKRIDHAYASDAIPEVIGTNDTPVQSMLPAPQPQQAITYQQQPQAQPAPQQQFQPAPQTFAAPNSAQPPAAPPPSRFTAAPIAPTNGHAPPQQGFQQAQAQAQPPQAAPGGFQQAGPKSGKGSRGGARPGAGRRATGAVAPNSDPNVPAGAAPFQQQPQAPQPTQPAPGGDGVPAFLRRGAATQQAPGPQPAPAPAAPQPQFGMQTPGAPNPDLSAALDRAFSVPPPRRQA